MKKLIITGIALLSLTACQKENPQGTLDMTVSCKECIVKYGYNDRPLDSVQVHGYVHTESLYRPGATFGVQVYKQTPDGALSLTLAKNEKTVVLYVTEPGTYAEGAEWFNSIVLNR